MMGMSLNNIYEHIYTAATFAAIISSYFKKKDERDEFRQFIILEITKVPEQLMFSLYDNDELKFYFASIVKNQVCSSTSPWHKQRYSSEIYSEDYSFDIPDEDEITTSSSYQKKRQVNKAINYLQGKNPKLMEDFDHFKWYYFDNKSYRQIEKMLRENGTPINRHTIRTKVIRAEALIKNYIKNNYDNNND